METELELPVAKGVRHASTGSKSVGSPEPEAGVSARQLSEHNSEGSANSDALEWIAFAKAAIPGARPMQDWERRDADDFFWSQFE